MSKIKDSLLIDIGKAVRRAWMDELVEDDYDLATFVVESVAPLIATDARREALDLLSPPDDGDSRNEWLESELHKLINLRLKDCWLEQALFQVIEDNKLTPGSKALMLAGDRAKDRLAEARKAALIEAREMARGKIVGTWGCWDGAAHDIAESLDTLIEKEKKDEG